MLKIVRKLTSIRRFPRTSFVHTLDSLSKEHVNFGQGLDFLKLQRGNSRQKTRSNKEQTKKIKDKKRRKNDENNHNRDPNC